MFNIANEVKAAIKSWQRLHFALIAAFFAALMLPFILAFALDLSLQTADPWVGKRNSTWCEYESQLGFIRARKATYTSFCYYAVGTYIFICAIYDAFLRPSPPFNKLTKHPVLSFCFGLVNILHALAVFYNHASGTNTGGKLDQSFMRGVILFPLIFSIYILFPNIHARRKISTAIPFSLVYMASVVLFLVESFNRIPYFAFAFFAPLMGLDLLGAFFLCFYFDGRPCRPTPRTQPMHLKFVISTLIFLLIGLGIWYPEYMFSICIAGTTPYTFIQAHGLWHFFTAIAILCSYFFMRSANRESAIDAILTNSCVESDHGHEVEMSTVSVSPTLGAPQESLEDRPRDDCT